MEENHLLTEADSQKLWDSSWGLALEQLIFLFPEARGRTRGVVYCGPNGSGVPVSRNSHLQAVGQMAQQPAPKLPPDCSGETHPLPGYSLS